MLALCDAISHLGRVRDQAAGFKLHPQIDRAIHHLAEAAMDLPDELWAVMLFSRQVGYEEVAARLHGAILEAKIS